MRPTFFRFVGRSCLAAADVIYCVHGKFPSTSGVALPCGDMPVRPRLHRVAPPAEERCRCGASGGAVAVAYAVTTRRGIVRVSVSVAPSRTTVMLCL